MSEQIPLRPSAGTWFAVAYLIALLSFFLVFPYITTQTEDKRQQPHFEEVFGIKEGSLPEPAAREIVALKLRQCAERCERAEKALAAPLLKRLDMDVQEALQTEKQLAEKQLQEAKELARKHNLL